MLASAARVAGCCARLDCQTPAPRLLETALPPARLRFDRPFGAINAMALLFASVAPSDTADEIHDDQVHGEAEGSI
ncbi:hypothetical protein [Streptomyces sp. NPDC001970]